MSESELFTAYFDTLAVVHANFEFWLTTTFAFILAFHFAGDRITKFFTRLLVALYVVATAIFIINWFNAGFLMIEFITQIESTTNIKVRSVGGINLAPPLILGMMIFGAIGSVYFAVIVSRNSESSET